MPLRNIFNYLNKFAKLLPYLYPIIPKALTKINFILISYCRRWYLSPPLVASDAAIALVVPNLFFYLFKFQICPATKCHLGHKLLLFFNFFYLKISL